MQTLSIRAVFIILICQHPIMSKRHLQFDHEGSWTRSRQIRSDQFFAENGRLSMESEDNEAAKSIAWSLFHACTRSEGPHFLCDPTNRFNNQSYCTTALGHWNSGICIKDSILNFGHPLYFAARSGNLIPLTPLAYAVVYNHVSVVKFLLKKGADTNVQLVTPAVSKQYAHQRGVPNCEAALIVARAQSRCIAQVHQHVLNSTKLPEALLLLIESFIYYH